MPLTPDLFDDLADVAPPREEIADGAVLLRGLARPIESDLIAAVRAIVVQAPFRQMFTPGGHKMSVAMTNCGERGWVTDRGGYRYDPIDPQSGTHGFADQIGTFQANPAVAPSVLQRTP